MDFVNNFPVELSELIFQHLSAKNLLKVSLVSSSWSTLIGKSTKLMKKVRIKFDKDSQSSKLTEIFKNSFRVYQHLWIKSFKPDTIDVIFKIFESKAKNIKSLKINYFWYSNNENLIKLIELFSENIEEITLGAVCSEFYKLDFEKFPKLKTLKVYWDLNCFSIFKECKNLVELNIKSFTSTERVPKTLVKILHQNKNLKVLKISLNIYNEIFTDQTIVKIPFKLCYFESYNYEYVNYENFFTHQLDSIQILKIPTIYHVENIKTIFMMPNLKELKLGNIEHLYFNNLDLAECKSLEKLKFKDTTLRLSIFNSIANAAPNLKELEIHSVSKEIMEILSSKMTKLKDLKLRTIAADNLSNYQFFSKLNNCTIEVIDEQFEFNDQSNYIINIKKQIRMNFINILPIEVSELIFQHLSFSELIKTTLVSKHWNKFIGESTNLMKNIKINFQEINVLNPLTSKSLNFFIESPRIYQNVEINSIEPNYFKDIYSILKSKKTNIKTLKIQKLHCINKIDFLAFMEHLSPTIEKITMNFVFFLPSNEFVPLNFSKLKYLKVKNSGYDMGLFNTFSDCENIREFRLKSFVESHIDKNALINILHRNKNLKIFELSSDDMKQIFENEEVMSKIRFKLHTFENYKCTKINFKNFFATQLDSIQKLKISAVYHAETLESIFKMKNLKELDLGNLDSIIHKNINLDINTSLEKFIYKNSTEETGIFNSIISSVPNLKELKMFAFNQESMELASRKLKYLEILKMRTIYAVDLSNQYLFPKLKFCQVEVLHSDLEDHMKAIPDESCSNFVKLMLASDATVLN
ncbi:hypothetical protein PVAND_013937 [Polypedilum vanderplanki]|uniref:F-box domain-containing protein n=1 Tax=Polypedilum vanderplanki TaxID=319348 RepID=A0A9J6CT06_POLVA|nr:hypothetical protein PVAND_013937 [Polypedilum vanderplanki]